MNHSGKRSVPLGLALSVNSLSLVLSVYYYITGPVELQWIFIVWGVASSILLLFIIKTIRYLGRR